MIGFISWQTALGFWVVGFIMGWAVSILVARCIVMRRNRKNDERS